MSDPQDPYRPTNDDQGPIREPQFGQRSQDWSAPAAPPVQPAGGERPWPVYQPGNGANPYPATPQYQQQPPQGPQYGPAGQQLPPSIAMAGAKGLSRAGAIWTIVLGVLLAIIVAPVITVATIVGGLNFEQMSNGSMEATNGGQVNVDASGTIAVIAATGSTLNTCSLAAADGSEWPMYVESSSTLMVGRGVPAGQYTINCDTAPGTLLLVLNEENLTDAMNAGVQGFLWGTLVGVIGLIAVIVGIVWLVRRNRARREFTRQQWGGPGGYGYQR